MIGLLTKKKAKISYTTSGRISGNTRLMSFIFMSNVNSRENLLGGTQPHISGFLTTSNGLPPESILLGSAEIPLYQDEINRVRLNTLTTVEQRLHRSNYPDNFLSQGNLIFTTYYRRLSTAEISPPTQMDFHINRPDLYKYISIENTQLGGGGAGGNNSVGLGTLDLKDFINCYYFYLGKSFFTQINLPPQIDQCLINLSLGLEVLRNLNKARLVFIVRVPLLSEIGDLSDDLENFTLGSTKLVDMADKFVNKTKLKTLALHERGNNNIVQPLDNSTWNGTLDLSDCSSLESLGVNAREGAIYKDVIYPSLSSLFHFKVEGDISLTNAKMDEIFNDKLEFFTYFFGGFTQVTQADLTTSKCPNLIDILFDRGANTFNLDLDLSNHTSLRNVQIRSTLCANIDLSNSSASTINLSGNGFGAYNFTNLLNCTNFQVSFVPMSRVSNVKNQIEANISVETLAISNRTNNDDFIGDFNLSQLINLSRLRIFGTGLPSITLPNNSSYVEFLVYDEPNLTTLTNFSVVRRIFGGLGLFSRGTNLDLDLSNLLQISSFNCSNNPQSIIDLSSIDTELIGDIRADGCTSLTRVTFPVINYVTRFVSFNNCSSLVQIDNLDKIQFLENNQNYRLTFINCTSLDIVLPFNARFIVPIGGISMANCVISQANMDTTIDNLWNNRAIQISGRALDVSGGTNAIPTGLFQAPSGFVLGSNDGTPTTPQEKIFVLVNNYNLIITTN